MSGVPAPDHLPLVPPPVLDADRRAEIVDGRLDTLRRLAAGRGSAGVLLDTRRDVAWVTAGGELFVVAGSERTVAPLLVTPDAAVVLAPVNEAARIAGEEVAGLSLEVAAVPWHDGAAAEAEATRWLGRDLGGLLAGDELETLLAPVRARLGPVEHARMRWLGKALHAALDAATGAAIPGRTESMVASVAAGALLAGGIRVPVLLAAADERLRYRHPIPGDTPLRDRMMLVVVAERWGVHVAATRMIRVGEQPRGPHPADAAAGRVLDAMAAASRPGATLGDVFAAAEEAYASEGLPGEWRNHHQGGTIGYAPRERIATPNDPTPIEARMALAWNPSVPGGKAEATWIVGDEGLELVVG